MYIDLEICRVPKQDFCCPNLLLVGTQDKLHEIKTVLTKSGWLDSLCYTNHSHWTKLLPGNVLTFVKSIFFCRWAPSNILTYLVLITCHLHIQNFKMRNISQNMS